MTGLFDFVRDIVDYSIEHEFLDIVEDVLKTTLQKNTNRHFLKWNEQRVHNYMDLDTDDLEDFFSDFHSLDHGYHHKVWSDTAQSIIYQFSRMFRDYPIEQIDIIHENQFRTLRKHVPEINKYMERFYEPRKHGVYMIKGFWD